MTGGWRKLHNEELHNLYSSPSIVRMIKSRKIRWTGQIARSSEKMNAFNVLVGTPEGKRPLRRPCCKWVNNFKIDITEIEWDGMDWIDLTQDSDH
jgi:hypothetical protein